jgi:hypothetical protein
MTIRPYNGATVTICRNAAKSASRASGEALKAPARRVDRADVASFFLTSTVRLVRRCRRCGLETTEKTPASPDLRVGDVRVAPAQESCRGCSGPESVIVRVMSETYVSPAAPGA